MKNSYGFSALFEAMAINERRMKNEDTIMDFASGAMESSLLGDDVVSAMGISDDGLPTGMEDYEDDVDSDSEMDSDMKRLDAALDDSISSEDEELGDIDEEAAMLVESLDEILF